MPGWSELGSAGPVLVLLGLMSLASVAVLIARLIGLAGVTRGRTERDAATDSAAAAYPGRTPADRVLSLALELRARGAGSGAMSAELEQAGNAEVAGMARGVRFLELVGMIAPLLGLLGTVLGMIQSFRSLEMAEGAANASILAGGIWQALLTTAAGLIVAIPALVGASVLSARVEAGTQEIERVIARMLSSVGGPHR